MSGLRDKRCADERDRQPSDESDSTIRWPKSVVEVLSLRTAGNDQGSKLPNSLTIPTVHEHLIVDSLTRSVVLHRRVAGEVVTTWPDELVVLDSIHATLSIDSLYSGTTLTAAE